MKPSTASSFFFSSHGSFFKIRCREHPYQAILQTTYPFASCNLKYKTSNESLLTFRRLLSDRHTPFKCMGDKGTAQWKKERCLCPFTPYRVQESRSPTYANKTRRTQETWPNSENRNKFTNHIYKCDGFTSRGPLSANHPNTAWMLGPLHGVGYIDDRIWRFGWGLVSGSTAYRGITRKVSAEMIR